jgi:neutral trehalase
LQVDALTASVNPINAGGLLKTTAFVNHLNKAVTSLNQLAEVAVLRRPQQLRPASHSCSLQPALHQLIGVLATQLAGKRMLSNKWEIPNKWREQIANATKMVEGI